MQGHANATNCIDLLVKSEQNKPQTSHMMDKKILTKNANYEGPAHGHENTRNGGD